MIEWKRLFEGNQVTPDAPAYILQAADMIVYDNLTREERAVIDAEDIFIQDRLAREDYVYCEGVALGEARGEVRGIAIGEAKGADERAELKTKLDNTVKRMKADGMDTAAICHYTGLSADEVAEL
jgi:predicted alpha-1,6-mannanase (GH76 family)